MSTVTPAKSSNTDNIIKDILGRLSETSASQTDDSTPASNSLSNEHLLALLQLLRQQQTTLNALTTAATTSGVTTIPDQSSSPTRIPPE
jgi:hypothetical protein